VGKTKKQFKTLYIIGNGFDIYHKLDTWYSTFGLFLRDNHSDIYEYFLKYFGFPELDENDQESLRDLLWSDFETNLSTLDIDEVLEEHAEYSANTASPDFSDKDWDDIAVYVGDIRDDLTIKMLDLFKEWILNVKYPNSKDIDIIEIEKGAIFFNFNYSKSLEHYYKIDQNQILYIHNRAESNDKLILGHGINPENFERTEERPPEGLTEEQLAQWEDAQSDAFDFSLERGRDELIQYFFTSFKATAKLIEKNIAFFNSLSLIDKVYVLGHSLSDVDKEYFEEIVKNVSKKAIWIISFNNPTGKKSRRNRMKEFGINSNQIILIQMKDLRPDFLSKIKLGFKIICARIRTTLNI